MENTGFIKYSHLYEREPESRVFAPLAESYRKLGMLQEAFELLKKGIQKHPQYALGYIVLARCHRDQGEFQRAYDVLLAAPKVDMDNFSYKFLRADLAYKLEEFEDALTLYEELLWLNPRGNYSHRIDLLKEKLEEGKPSYSEEQEVTDLTISEESGKWVSVDFSATTNPPKEVDSEDMMTYTIIKLYLDQGYYGKALQVANAFLEKNPDNFEVREMRDGIVSQRLFEREPPRFEEDDELSEDHIEEEKRLDIGAWASDEESLVAPYLKSFQERINLKSAQVKMSSYGEEMLSS